jgi:hypothetical protein
MFAVREGNEHDFVDVVSACVRWWNWEILD